MMQNSQSQSQSRFKPPSLNSSEDNANCIALLDTTLSPLGRSIGELMAARGESDMHLIEDNGSLPMLPSPLNTDEGMGNIESQMHQYVDPDSAEKDHHDKEQARGRSLGRADVQTTAGVSHTGISSRKPSDGDIINLQSGINMQSGMSHSHSLPPPRESQQSATSLAGQGQQGYRYDFNYNNSNSNKMKSL